ncbi:MAG: kynureninase [Pseudomonadota bacterium]
MTSLPTTREACLALDAVDPLAAFRSRFTLPADLIYLDGNSLGALPAATPARLAKVIADEWSTGLIRSWNAAQWVDLPQRLGDKLAPLIGAAPGTTRVCDSTSVNLFKLLAAALAARPGRTVIVSEADNFPTDLYIAEGLASLLGQQHTLRLVAVDEIEAALDEHTAVLMLSHVNYRTGRLHDMAALTAAAHAQGALTLWDLAHSAGALPVQLADAAADFAVGCGYKYLNGGPGAPAFLYVAPAHQAELAAPLSGWFGHARPFAFENRYAPAAGVDRLLVGTPPVLSMAALEVGIDLMAEVDLAQLREKSLRMSALFAARVAAELGDCGLTLVSPQDDAQRGSQVCFAHSQAWPVMQALIARGVIGDFRAPDILRFGFTPLYLSYTQVWDAVTHLAQVLRSREWDAPQFHQKNKVT